MTALHSNGKKLSPRCLSEFSPQKTDFVVETFDYDKKALVEDFIYDLKKENLFYFKGERYKALMLGFLSHFSTPVDQIPLYKIQFYISLHSISERLLLTDMLKTFYRVTIEREDIANQILKPEL